MENVLKLIKPIDITFGALSLSVIQLPPSRPPPSSLLVRSVEHRHGDRKIKVIISGNNQYWINGRGRTAEILTIRNIRAIKLTFSVEKWQVDNTSTSAFHTSHWSNNEFSISNRRRISFITAITINSFITADNLHNHNSFRRKRRSTMAV